MNDKQIYELVARQPRIRASDIANEFKVELTAVSAALRSLVDIGDLTKHTEFGENGRQWQVYELSAEFKASRDGKALAPTVVQVPGPFSFPLPTSAPAPAPAPAAEADPPARSKVDRAIAFITRHGAASASELRDAMGLAADASVSTYLTSARKAGRVFRDGALWKLGTGQRAAAQPADVANVVTVGNVILATPDLAAVPVEVKAALTEMATAAVTELRKPDPAPEPPAGTVAPPPDAYRCAHWSDGTIELRLNGEEVARLSEQELDFINAFLAKRRAA